MQEKVKAILKEIRPEIDFSKDDNINLEHIFDSFDLATIITDLEETFNIEIDGDDINRDNFVNLDAIINLVKKYMD